MRKYHSVYFVKQFSSQISEIESPSRYQTQKIPHLIKSLRVRKSVPAAQQIRKQYGNRRMRKNAVPSFIQKAWQILQSEQNEDILRWTESGCSFIVLDRKRLCEGILSVTFKHSNFSSFVRQLNMYNFHKMRNNDEKLEFFHKLFRKDHRQLLIGIKRKPSQAELIFGDQLIAKLVNGGREDRNKEIHFSENCSPMGNASNQLSLSLQPFPLPFSLREARSVDQKEETEEKVPANMKIVTDTIRGHDCTRSNSSEENQIGQQCPFRKESKRGQSSQNFHYLFGCSPLVVSERFNDNAKGSDKTNYLNFSKVKERNRANSGWKAESKVKIVENIILQEPPRSQG